MFFAFSAVNAVGVRSGTAKNTRNAKDTVDTGSEIVSFVSSFFGSEVDVDLLIPLKGGLIEGYPTRIVLTRGVLPEILPSDQRRDASATCGSRLDHLDSEFSSRSFPGIKTRPCGRVC